MLGKRREILPKEQGFTLVELITVLVILGIVLSIGVPKYLKIQAQAEYDADAAIIKSFAKAAEMYVVKNDLDLSEENTVSLDTLITAKVIDGTKVLKRKNDGSDKSVKNNGTSISAYSSESFEFDAVMGTVTNLEGDTGLIVKLIGKPIYK
ncbi:MAG: prepilin-type N-terminal cleavage/methylation domain-containing protein [Clostridia bacterium]|nr:prepilin-type N-terminal cleavage/methylation domain-containing protein [Clostridia bacterium]